MSVVKNSENPLAAALKKHPDGNSMAPLNRAIVLDDAWSLFRLISNDPDSLRILGRAIDDAGSAALQGKVKHLTEYVSTTNTVENIARLEDAFTALAFDNDDLVEFDVFQERVETELAGIVITAHPTFSLSPDAWAHASDLLHSALDDADETNQKSRAEHTHGTVSLLPTASPSLNDELAYANAAIKNIRLSLRDVWHACISVATKLYPGNWQQLTPSVVTIASWVGFDLDGRTDINWSQSLHFRYATTLLGLEELQTFWSSIAQQLDATAHKHTSTVAKAIDTLHTTFTQGLEALREADEMNHFAAFNRLTVERHATKDKARKEIAAGLDALMTSALPLTSLQTITTFKAEWSTIGLGLSHIHFRLNAAQLHNAIRPVINLQQAPDRSASRRYYLDAVAKLLENVTPVSIHYGTVAKELTTAKRVFMLAAQFRKHFDDNGSLRVLVAESDTPFTLLVALYYAKLFGVDDYVEISPLFETAIGLQRGDQVISELLDNPQFADYIEQQGRFCVQLGFSDSGRYIGQIAASLAIERFKLRLARLWKKRGLEHIQLVFFDTHGESIGRGAHPGSMKERFYYTHTPEVRRSLNQIGNQYKHEVSFQGGDGYMWFLHPKLALAALTDLITTRLKAPAPEADALYDNSDWSLDFFLTLTETQENLTKDKGYIRLIDSIGQSMLYPTGSRAVKRQGRGKAGGGLESIGQIRAIPNNAVLQQLGYMANTIAGLGLAASRNPRRFTEIAENSPRLKSLMAMALSAREASDISILSAYLSALSPSYWLDRCEAEAPSKERSMMLRLSKSLEGVFDGSSMRATLRKLRRDGLLLEDMLETMHVNDTPPATLDPEIRALHTLRIALIHYIHLKAMEVPQFSNRQDISLDDLITELLHLNVEETVKELRKIFPSHAVNTDDALYGEDASYDLSNASGYIREHKQIFDMIDQACHLTLKISSVLATKIGAVG